MSNPLSQVRKGMRVSDSAGKEIGTVDWVHLSDEDPDTPQAETVTPGAVDYRERTSLIDFIANAFRVDDVPEVLQNRLLRDGFLRVDADGLFAADRYVLPEQIRSVSDDQVMLGVTKDDLVKRR